MYRRARSGPPISIASCTVCSYAGENPESRAIARSKAQDLGRCEQRLAKVISRLADTLPYLGVSRISARRGVERREEAAVHGEKRRVLVIQRQFERVGKKEQAVPRAETLVQGGRLQTVRLYRLEALPE